MNIRTTLFSLALASCLAVPLAHAETHGLSEESHFSPSEKLVLSVVLTPYIVGSGVVASAQMSANASAKASTNFSQALSSNTDWTVVGLHNERNATQVELQSEDGKLRMTLAIPAQEVAARGIRLQDHIAIKRLGQDSFAAQYAGQPLGVLTNPAAHLAHSSKRN